MSSLPAKWRKAPSASEIIVELEHGDKIIRRLNGKDAAEAVRVERLLRELREAVIPLLARMSADDFTQLVELLFTSGGWRRHSTDAQAKLSELEPPSTGERALVLSTPKASQTELDDFRAKFGASTYDRLIFVYPTGAARSIDPRITTIGPEQLGRIVLEMGLLSWLLNRVS